MRTDPHITAYTDFLASKVAMKMPLKVVCDFSNGPVSIVMRELAGRLSSSLGVVMMNENVHPDFPAHGPDPSVPEALVDIAKKIIETKADLGIIFDGDGDRAVFVDERGVPVPPSVIALFLMKNTPGTHVVDVLLYEALTHLDPSFRERIIISKVGRYFISQAMKKHEAVLGAEFSGHFFFKDFFGLDSALLNMIAVLNTLSGMGSQASVVFSKYAGHTVIASKASLTRPFLESIERLRSSVAARNPRISDMDGLTVDFGESWVNLRPSNTEPVARITAGAKDPVVAGSLVEEFKKALA